MATILICVRHGNTIFDFAVFGKDYVPIQFEESAIGLAMRHDPCSNHSQYFVIRSIPYIIEEHDSHCRTVSKTPQFFIGTHAQCNCPPGRPLRRNFAKLALIYILPHRRKQFRFPATLANCCFNEIVKCKKYRRNFILFLKKHFKFKSSWKWHCMCSVDESVCSYSVQLPTLIEICLTPTAVHVCYAWCYRLEGLLVKRYILEETMAWLSTLGGGFSSLGDYFVHFSEEAGKLSVTQLRIAMEMGDPIMASKCRLFYGLSLMQQGQLRCSKRIIRREYHFATHHRIRDQKLIDMCHGMWSKLQHLYVKRKLLNSCGHHDNSKNNLKCELEHGKQNSIPHHTVTTNQGSNKEIFMALRAMNNEQAVADS